MWVTWEAHRPPSMPLPAPELRCEAALGPRSPREHLSTAVQRGGGHINDQGGRVVTAAGWRRGPVARTASPQPQLTDTELKIVPTLLELSVFHERLWNLLISQRQDTFQMFKALCTLCTLSKSVCSMVLPLSDLKRHHQRPSGCFSK